MDTLTRRLTRAAVWSADGVRVCDVELPTPGPGELLVRVDLATVCGSDLHTVSGRRPAPSPSILGHEAVGRVVAAGPGADQEVGGRIVWSVTAACGRCARCKRGFTAKCEQVRKVGHEAFTGDWPLSGGYAEHILLPAGVTTVTVPQPVPDAVAAPAGCATATVMAVLEAAGDLAGRRVLICGAGMLGVTAVGACAERGAHVLISDPHPERCDLAVGFGARPDTGGPVDIALDFSGSATAVAAALSRIDLGGTLVLAGSVTPGSTVAFDPEAVVRGWLTITGVHNYEPRHLVHAVEFLSRTYDTLPWHGAVAAPVGLDAIDTVLAPPPRGVLRASINP
ncbi:zinc-binding dehydrogenase [Nocardia flavorosea]|uniref:alcohol dehydrogenase n=1 Tax=Nocardia flavorosea TaxID=53429 RepID=A0A846YFI0_9NOCA|nr:zinc-binding dehydrogenase [Nocardia flavorosea]NKY56464.1 alcohol dehydrogenase catalytic domain-containing protein [Nocardia flavorosea]